MPSSSSATWILRVVVPAYWILVRRGWVDRPVRDGAAPRPPPFEPPGSVHTTLVVVPACYGGRRRTNRTLPAVEAAKVFARARAHATTGGLVLFSSFTPLGFFFFLPVLSGAPLIIGDSRLFNCTINPCARKKGRLFLGSSPRLLSAAAGVPRGWLTGSTHAWPLRSFSLVPLRPPRLFSRTPTSRRGGPPSYAFPVTTDAAGW